MDKSWMKQSRLSDVYDEGVKRFLDFAFRNLTSDEIIRCPCKKCKLRSLVTREVAYDHLIAIGFLEDYTTLVFHGELESSSAPNNEANSRNRSYMDIDMESLMHEAFGIPSSHETENHMPTGFEDQLNEDQPNPEATTFFSFVKDANKELYPGCETYTKLSFIIYNNSFSMLLNLLKAILPDGESLPNSFCEMKKIIGKLGLECPKCHTSRYVIPEGDSNNSASSELASSKVPAKVLRYFPLIPRLQRLFISSMTASVMRWHKEDRTKDGYMRHPADSPAWKTFDHKHPDFSAEPRNVRLGLATDGMNPFKTMSTTYSIWPVILMAYTLPSWMCMDRENLFLSMIIPGPSSPGNNIDVYLRPLIDELNLLWGDGVVTFDISTKTNFRMRAALMWTISDLPGLAYVSGWSTRGKYGCICCHKETCSTWLKYGRKFCYMGHRRFLEKNHAFRKDDKSFYGGKENGSAPLPLDGCTILEMLEGVQIEFGKNCANPDLPYNWKKKSIFFELPYWKDNLIRHNLDVMHIEKNVCESIIGTLLNLEGKTKDGLNARLDLELVGLKQELHPKRGQNQKTTLPSACYSLKKEEKTSFCKFLKNVKVPDAYAANISRCVNVKDKKIFGMKSHDCHILIQQLLPLAVRGMLSPIVRECLVDLSNFFREIYSKVKMPQDFMHLEKKISNTLCKLEKIFPPAFFDIVVHLLVHLPREAQLAGPVQYRQMYPIER
ncbi:hypothetical protein ACJIZ3_003669 [Penstemon smallii]|uniref:Transposase n=1 Tax=Penstemon smallii TaxID=265156 RepID=A0ABD3UBG2_9LAMI